MSLEICGVTSYRKEIGKRIQVARRSAGFKSAKALAEQLGVRRETVSAYEAGMYDVPMESLRKIAELTGKSLTFFFNDHDGNDPAEVEELQREIALIGRMGSILDDLQRTERSVDAKPAEERVGALESAISEARIELKQLSKAFLLRAESALQRADAAKHRMDDLISEQESRRDRLLRESALLGKVKDADSIEKETLGELLELVERTYAERADTSEAPPAPASPSAVGLTATDIDRIANVVAEKLSAELRSLRRELKFLRQQEAKRLLSQAEDVSPARAERPRTSPTKKSSHHGILSGTSDRTARHGRPAAREATADEVRANSDASSAPDEATQKPRRGEGRRRRDSA